MSRAILKRGKQLLARVLLGIMLILPYGASAIYHSAIGISLLLMVALLLIAWSRISFYAFAFIALAASLLQLIYTLYAGRLIDEYYWIASVSANKNEALSFIESMKLSEILVYIFYLGAVFCLMILGSRKRFYKFDSIGKSIFVVTALVISVHYGANFRATLAELKLFPAYIANSFFNGNSNLHKLIVHKELAFQKQQPAVDDVYLYLGESASKLRMSAYGYSKKTTPGFDGGNWIKFNDYIANGLNTQPNLKAAFSGKVLTANDLVEFDIIRLAKLAGFKVIYIDNNKYQSADPIYVIGAQSDKYISLNGIGVASAESDDRIKFDDVLESHLESVSKIKQRKLVIVHLAGSHPSQKMRYPQSFDKFSNAYDNSIYYTDYLVNKWVMDIQKKYPDRAIASIYLSDHGVRIAPGCGLGDIKNEDYSSYGADDRYFSNVAIPLFVNVNNKFLESNPGLVSNLKRSVNRPLDHTAVLPSLAKLFGYQTLDSYSLKKSIFSDDVSYVYPRVNTDGQNIDVLIKNNLVCRNK